MKRFVAVSLSLKCQGPRQRTPVAAGHVQEPQMLCENDRQEVYTLVKAEFAISYRHRADLEHKIKRNKKRPQKVQPLKCVGFHT